MNVSAIHVSRKCEGCTGGRHILLIGSLVTAVASATVILASALALHVREFVHDVLKNEHEGAVGDEVAGTAVPTFAEEVVESAASVLLVEVCLACHDLGVIDLVGHEAV